MPFLIRVMENLYGVCVLLKTSLSKNLVFFWPTASPKANILRVYFEHGSEGDSLQLFFEYLARLHPRKVQLPNHPSRGALLPP